MPTQLVNYASSVPTNFNDSITRNVTVAPISVAKFGMSIPTTDTNVVLFGSVGFRSTLGAPEILFKVIREGVIASTLSSPVAAGEFRNVPISFVDRNVPIGHHAYTLTAELTTSSITTEATIVGPVTLTGLAITI